MKDDNYVCGLKCEQKARDKDFRGALYGLGFWVIVIIGVMLAFGDK